MGTCWADCTRLLSCLEASSRCRGEPEEIAPVERLAGISLSLCWGGTTRDTGAEGAAAPGSGRFSATSAEVGCASGRGFCWFKEIHAMRPAAAAPAGTSQSQRMLGGRRGGRAMMAGEVEAGEEAGRWFARTGSLLAALTGISRGVAR